MQLKKRLAIKKHLAVGAMTVVMLASSLPAFASDGERDERGKNRGLGFGLDAKIGVNGNGDAGLALEIRNELKAFKNDLKTVRVEAKADASASATEIKKKREEERACKAEAGSKYREAISKAQVERDAAHRNAQAKYLADLKAARDAFHKAIGLQVSATGSASGTSVTVSAEVRAAAIKAYREAVKTAQRAFNDAKKAARDEYRKDVREAQEARRTAEKTCREND